MEIHRLLSSKKILEITIPTVMKPTRGMGKKLSRYISTTIVPAIPADNKPPIKDRFHIAIWYWLGDVVINTVPFTPKFNAYFGRWDNQLPHQSSRQGI